MSLILALNYHLQHNIWPFRITTMQNREHQKAYANLVSTEIERTIQPEPCSVSCVRELII